ncbi:RNA polymerase epsilon subunit [Fructobacillus parabroussonetiae]|uniref:DNA-directed RNA polymerase subunit epsilon n=1 Tax=Fructobacillus parabroussonetiae TaxID=2713174 RepID=A0ABS5QX69_9LACO|nr:RNA polymerase epsilon subunit [Fructobacillus parabroussonetiae]MBS9337794.1 DNA-dependent RNA polymerase auxiliary subunit epsilon family protein [Fructobacillus parabroussonetiae]MCK8616782.1 DNA-dependent RNA polymerase auxiliary subunit epsilon family protein [Fructobacillus parabroussonetiae]
MVYKVYYQESMDRNPKRENTQSFFLEADSHADAYALAQKNTDFNIETVEELSDAALVYEQADPEFSLTTFN